MRKLVLDSSVAFKWLVLEDQSDLAKQLRDEFKLAILDLIAPEFWTVELAHSLTRAERQGRINVGDAYGLWVGAMRTAPQFIPHVPLMERAMEISSQERIGVYDCHYVALAEREGCELVTADTTLVKALQKKYGFILTLTGLYPPASSTP